MRKHVYILISTPEGTQPEPFDSHNLHMRLFENPGAMYDWIRRNYVNIDPTSIQTEGNIRWKVAYKKDGTADRLVIRKEDVR